MKIIKQIGIIFAICWLSQIVESFLPFPFPAAVIGMVLLFAALFFRLLSVTHIQEKSDFLLSNLAFFFVPAGVSIMNHFNILGENLIPFLAVCTFSTILTFAATAYSIRLTLYLMRRYSNGRAF